MLLAAVVLLVLLSNFPVEAQNVATVSVEAAAPDHRTGDTVEIFGVVNPVLADRQVVIQVYNPKNALVRIDPVDVASNGRSLILLLSEVH